jgi:hypothetical protein
MKDVGKENQKPALSSTPKCGGKGVQKPSKRVKTEHAAAGQIDVKMGGRKLRLEER